MLKFANEAEKRVYLYPENQDELEKYFKNNTEATLIIDFDEYYQYPNKDFFFKEINQIKFKRILLIGNGSYHFHLEKLKSNDILIELNDYYSEIAYDFKGFPNLEVLKYEYIKGSSDYSLLSKLRRELTLRTYSKKDIEEFLRLSNLEELRFVQSKIENLKGVHQFEKLKSVFLVANKNLMLIQMFSQMKTSKNYILIVVKKLTLT